jgi:hypothetical protein
MDKSHGGGGFGVFMHRKNPVWLLLLDDVGRGGHVTTETNPEESFAMAKRWLDNESL